MSNQSDMQPDSQPGEEFVPKGAMAFMVLMILAYGAVWLFFFYLMIIRP